MRYDDILIDCPWRWQNYNSTERAKRGEQWGRARGRPHYDCMDDDELAALPIADLCHKDTVLFMWAVEPKQEEAYRVMRAWGFRPVTTVFTWVKLTPQAFRNYEQWQREERDLQWILDRLFHVGSGFWTRKNVEVVLLGRRNNGRQGEIRRDQRGLVVTPVGDHSVKPAEVHRRIERMRGPRPRLEIFGRRREPGWDVIGDGVDGLDIRESLRRVKEGLPLPGVGQPEVRGPLRGDQEELLRALWGQGAAAAPVPWKPDTERHAASISRSLARLERRGLLQRIRPGGRTTHVLLTTEGGLMAERLTGSELLRRTG